MSNQSVSTLLDVQNLVTRFYTEDGTVYAVNDVSFSLDSGESMAIVGESACGKSVSMLSILRLIPTPPGRIEAGKVFFKGRDLFSLSQSQMRDIRGSEIALILQDPMTSLNPVLSIKRQITEVIKRHLQLSNNEAVKLAIEMLTVVGLPDPIHRINDFPHQFSGGQRQRIMIAMALATNPSLLIADEPTTALDTTIQAQIVDLVKKLQKQFGMAIIWITHDLALITGLVQKIAVMYAGTIVEMTTTRNLYKNTSHPYTLGLLQSLPTTANNIDDEKIRLIPIEGSPPNLLEEPSFCAFAPRCVYAVDKCWQEKPILDLVDDAHYVACWKWETVRNRV